MQRTKNMTETLKFVYVLILFISLFVVLMICDSAFLQKPQPCIIDRDCPSGNGYFSRCRNGHCKPFFIY